MGGAGSVRCVWPYRLLCVQQQRHKQMHILACSLPAPVPAPTRLQFDVLWPQLSVREHLELWAAIKGFPR